MSILKRLLSNLRKDAFGDEIAHHIRDLGMPRDQAVAVAYSEEERGHKIAKDVSVATGLTHHDQLGVRYNKISPSEVSETVKRSTKR